MLRKLFKIEFKSTARKFIPIIIGYLSVSLIMKLFLSLNDAAQDVLAIQLIVLLVTILYVVLTYTVSLYAIFGSIARFRKNLFTDEGYLMNTLPVKPWHHIFSKLFSAFIWYIISFGVMAGSMFILAYDNTLLKQIGNFLKEVGLNSSKLIAKYPLIVFLVILLSLISFIFIMLIFYMSTSIGNAITSAKKGVMSVVITIVILSAISFISVYSGFAGEKMLNLFNITSGKGVATFALAFYCIFCAV
ncbi:MAG: hypothetical protein GX896_09210, partial [Clostridiales bacterium]|nr:hypothetical protein [Clostridiales bacterium]